LLSTTHLLPPFPHHPTNQPLKPINLRVISQKTELALHRIYPHPFTAFPKFSFN